jgi:hypothetical protein
VAAHIDGVLRPGGSDPRCTRRHRKDHFLKIRRDIWDTSTQPLHKIYLPHKSYLKRKRMAKLHKTFESFLTAWEHKGEFAQTLFAKRFFCRKLYLVQGRCPKKRACIAA